MIEQQLKWKADAHRQLMPDSPFIFSEWLLKYGKAMGPVIKRRGTGLRLGAKKQCYQNSFQALSRHMVDPNEWFYTEGVVMREKLPIEIDHAWLSNAKGEVLDLTLRPPMNKKRKQENDLYFGIPFEWDYVVHKTIEHGYYGLFSNGMTYNKDVIDSIEEGIVR